MVEEAEEGGFTARDVSGERLFRALQALGYVPTRQAGSHVRMTTQRGGELHLTIPRHHALRVGTLAGIPEDVSDHLGLSRDELLRQLRL